jgi:tRNA(Arg) A34 adenosine deaminase TadA
MNDAEVLVDLPPWARELERVGTVVAQDDDRMRLAIQLSRLNVDNGTGGPFGAAIFESESGRLVAIGVNSVVRLNQSSLHAEMVAYMRAQARVASYTLAAPHLPAHALYTSCEPCAMCLGAALWSGVQRVVYAASREDAIKLRFDEGPVFPESYAYLERRGIRVTRELLRDEANLVLELYRARGGLIYNR